MNLANRILEMPESPIRKLIPFAENSKQNGIKVYHLNIGDPDIKTPQVMLDALYNFKPSVIRYANSKGEKVFIKALCAYYNGLGLKTSAIKPENMQVTMGGSEAIFWAFFALCNLGDEVIVFEPFYANYNSYAQTSGIKLVPVLTKIENGFHLPKISEIEKKLTKKTKAILICNPNNPTGTLYSFEELDLLVKLAKKNHLYLLSDEVYREFAYDGKKQISALEFDYPEGIVVLDSLSKRYSLCGARLGCIVSKNLDLISKVLKLGQARLSAGFIDQIIASELTKVPKSYLNKINREYEKRRNTVIAGLSKIPGVVFHKPEGAFYIIAKLPISDCEEFAKWLLTDYNDNNETVMVAPLVGFYKTIGLGIQEIRIAYVINRIDLKRAMELLKLAITKFNSIKTPLP
jgi:aspartate aminotransferase